jgi:DNA polymerase-1
VLDDLAAGTPVALARGAREVAIAWPGGSTLVHELPALRADLRWVWWSARELAPLLVGRSVRACWDLAAVGGLVHGLRRSDPPAVWAAAAGLPLPDPRRGDPDLFGLDGPLVDGQLVWTTGADDPTMWASLALDVHARQRAALDGLALRVAYAESAAALLCIEMEARGLPYSVEVAGQLLASIIGGQDDAGAAAERARPVLDALPAGTTVDLRSPEQVRSILAREGIDVPDTRSWRLEPHAAASPLVRALLAWRKADRVATTYGWRWLESSVSGGRLRGEWMVADGGAGRMTAGSGLHNMPAELRPAVIADPGWVLVGADLGQVEPRVLAVISRDPAFAEAAAADDLYAPVATKLRIDRPAAKVAVLAAMYGQTSGTAGAALKDLDRAYPDAMGYLRAAEQVGRDGGTLRTYGGRLLRFDVSGGGGANDRGAADAVQARGRYARNAVVQGAAAELFKAWAATVRAGLASLEGEIVLCLHDELLLHVPESESVAAQALLTDALAQVVRWWGGGTGVRFVAEVTSGPDWPSVH